MNFILSSPKNNRRELFVSVEKKIGFVKHVYLIWYGHRGSFVTKAIEKTRSSFSNTLTKMGSDKPLVYSHVSEDAAAAKYDDNEEEDIVMVPRTEEERLLKQQLIALFDTLNTDESISIANTIIRFFETQKWGNPLV